MDAIEITGIHKTFLGKNRARVNALKGLSLTVEKGEVFGFLGPNGAGKSTTIKILMGLISPSAGRVRLMGFDVKSHLSRIYVGYLPENPAFYDYLTASEYLSFTAKTFGMNGARINIKSEEVLKLLDLWDARNRPMREYSKGMVQRLGLAQTLIHDPDVFILDEPMSGLDPVGRALVKQIIFDLRARGKCVFFSTHITADVETVCDRVGVIVDGTLQCVEEVGTILTSGIVGYHIRYRAAGVREQAKLVRKEDIAKTMAELLESGHEVTLIEPERQSLETFFLNIVRGKKC
jgi:ABC-2 type transport system ATP-binding protein